MIIIIMLIILLHIILCQHFIFYIGCFRLVLFLIASTSISSDYLTLKFFILFANTGMCGSMAEKKQVLT